MELVVDANIVMSTLIALTGDTCELLFLNSLSLIAPELLKEEVENHSKEIMEKSGLFEEDFKMALALIFSQIEIIPFSEYEDFISEAKKYSPDSNDVVYFALALQRMCSLWSNDKLLKKQEKVKVISTSELIVLLK